jgi:hypothetical protein
MSMSSFRCQNLLLVFFLSPIALACQTREVGPGGNGGFLHQDEFSSSAPSKDWVRGVGEAGSGKWTTLDGWLRGSNLKNDPLWLRAPLPRDCRVEFDARSKTPDADVKFEIFGDGQKHASGYVLIHGGWKNSLDAIARLDEHGSDRVARKSRGVVQGQVYHHMVEWRDGALHWEVDGKPFLKYVDKEPLFLDDGHRHFGFNNWSAAVEFDNFRVSAPASKD